MSSPIHSVESLIEQRINHFARKAEVERLERYGEQDMQSKAKREAERVLTSGEDD